MSPKKPDQRRKRSRQKSLVTARSTFVASKADERGRAVTSDPEAFEAIASEPDRVAEALIARYTQRMERTRELPIRLRAESLSALASLTVLDKAVLPLAPTPGRPPSMPFTRWADQLAWGVDSAVATVRLLLCGQFLGAAAVARNQLERWTHNREHLARANKQAGESEAEFIARVWTSPIDPDAIAANPELGVVFNDAPSVLDEDGDHAHVVLTDGREVCPAAMWSILSELLHGRGPVGAIRWEILDILDEGRMPDEVMVAAGAIIDATALTMAHLRRVLEAIHRANGKTAEADILKAGFDSFSSAQTNQSVRLADVEIPTNMTLRGSGR